jgi:hypothetical protein
VSAGKSALARGLGFGLVTLVFAVTQPLMLAGLPLAVFLIATGPRDLRAGLLVTVLVASAFLGERSGLWWFERGWPLMLAGGFVWVEAWRRAWGFSEQALAALGFAVVAATAVFVASSGAWLDIEALMAARANAAAQMARTLLADRTDLAVESTIQKVVGLQVALFPALLAISSMAALGVAVTVRDWLAGAWKPGMGRLRSFRFNDHLVWVWLLGLGLLVAPVGQIADRIGGNAMFFMGALYVLRGVAVLLSIVGAIPWSVAIVGGLLAVLLYPALALVLTVALIVGLGDTWLNMRSRFAGRGGDR